MTREEFKQKAEAFASMYVSDYAMGDVRVEVDACEPGEEPRGRIAFRTYRDESEQSVPICVGGKNLNELELDLPDCDGHALDPQNFWVYLWNEACERAVRAEGALVTEHEATESNNEKLAAALGCPEFSGNPSTLRVVAVAKVQSLRLAEAELLRVKDSESVAVCEVRSLQEKLSRWQKEACDALAAEEDKRYALERILGKLSSVLFIQAGRAVLTGLPVEQLDAVGHLVDWATKRAGHRMEFAGAVAAPDCGHGTDEVVGCQGCIAKHVKPSPEKGEGT